MLIAGTKGKGSTAAILESLARAAGWRTGLYTQPHLDTFRERLRLDGQPISQALFVTLVSRLRRLVARLRADHPEAGEPTTFELTTVLAVLACAEASVDLTILEVGLGGRLDATNAVDSGLSVLARIGLDHTEILGNTIAEIAREKAGIIRPQGPVVSALQRRAARDMILARCVEVGACCRFVRPLPGGAPEATGQQVVVRLPSGPPFAATLHLQGAHQRQNAALALAAASELASAGLALTPDSVRTALAEARAPGRVEVIRGAPTWVLDAAHNADSATALARTLDEVAPSRPRWTVLGILRDKDAAAVARVLVPGADGIVVAAPKTPRALPAEELADICRRAGAESVESAESIADALDRARTAAGPRGTVIATGSFAVVSEARAALGMAESDA